MTIQICYLFSVAKYSPGRTLLADVTFTKTIKTALANIGMENASINVIDEVSVFPICNTLLLIALLQELMKRLDLYTR